MLSGPSGKGQALLWRPHLQAQQAAFVNPPLRPTLPPSLLRTPNFRTTSCLGKLSPQPPPPGLLRPPHPSPNLAQVCRAAAAHPAPWSAECPTPAEPPWALASVSLGCDCCSGTWPPTASHHAAGFFVLTLRAGPAPLPGDVRLPRGPPCWSPGNAPSVPLT